MNPVTLLILLGVTLVLGIVCTVMIVWHLGKHDRAVRARIAEARQAGRHETLSLHPVVDEGKCIGCEECVRGCPEEDVLLTYRNKAVVDQLPLRKYSHPAPTRKANADPDPSTVRPSEYAIFSVAFRDPASNVP